MVITIGCRLNQEEGDALRNLLQQQGYQVTTMLKGLDLCIVNTCTVTKSADRTSIKWIKRIAGLKPKPKLIVTGCLAQTAAERLKRIKGVDQVINQIDKVKLIEDCPILPVRARVFLKIQDGCCNRCAFCIPSRLRGIPVSKPMPIVEKEVRDLIAQGYQEIVLVGLNLGAYGLDLGSSLVALLKNLTKIKEEFRIRLSSLEPDAIEDELLNRFDEFRLCRHLHIPLQSGDDRILSLMGRRYTVAQYQQLIEKIVGNISDINIGTDLIVGFPSEDDESFNKTLALVRNLPFGYLHAFPYSPRPGTEAFNLRDDIISKEKKRRVNILRALSLEKTLDFRRRFMGKILNVIIEQENRATSDNYIRIFLSQARNGSKTGRLAKALITDVRPTQTFGELVLPLKRL